ncbi:PorT family protein [Rhodocytophaga rosea]|uniref:PorT family protein n=1 Tax=Rhodocytophaga rosea TaxID=2704465 RepID=A0A6C0GFK5_9BACT|nr:outer membrane beta-barrel protein [Rhodocytophaga rosea]QHT66470.1 PorT family protein [Rhodocytophaga rosea]
MKKLYILIALFVGISSTGFCFTDPVIASEKDSIIVLFGKKTRIVVHSEDRQELQKLKNFDFNALFDQVLAVSEKSQSNTASKDTSFVMNGDSVIVRGSDVLVKDNDKSISFTIRIGKDKDEDTEEDELELSENDSTIVTIRSKRSSSDSNYRRFRERRENRERHHKRTEGEFRLDLGLNNYLENGQIPDQSNQPYELRPLGSRYGALSYIYKTRIGNQKSPFYLTHGIEFSANNFMFDGNSRIRKGVDGVTFEDTGIDLRRNKLTVWYLSIPVMPMLDFKRARLGSFRFGFGGYVGYRIHSYSKIMYFDGGDREKDHEKSNFYLNNIRYGLQTQISLFGVNFFAKYDLNPLFSTGKGPSPSVGPSHELHALSFGIRL